MTALDIAQVSMADRCQQGQADRQAGRESGRVGRVPAPGGRQGWVGGGRGRGIAASRPGGRRRRPARRGQVCAATDTHTAGTASTRPSRSAG